MASTQRVVAGAVLILLGSVSLFGSVTSPGQSAPAAPAADKADALSEAARKGDAAMVKKLLDEGVDVNTRFRYDVTALFYACDRGHLDVVKVLLDHGANVNLRDTFYKATPLSLAADPNMGRKPQHAEIVRLLLKHGAEGKDDALRSAVSAADAAMTTIVLEQGGFSPETLSGALELARKEGKQDIAALLEKAGAKPYVEFKLDADQLARYTGTYREPRGNDLVLTVKDGRLTGAMFGQQVTFMARDETTFRLLEAPGMTVVFHLEQGKASALDLAMGGQGKPTTYTRVEGK